MFEVPLNQKTVTCKLRRIEVCDLMIACTAISSAEKDAGQAGKKWDDLHDRLKQILDDFDKKHGF